MKPQKIIITSTYWDINGDVKRKLNFIRKPDGYYIRDNKLPHPHIEALLAAINEPSIPKLNLVQLDVTPAWLDDNANAALNEYLQINPSSEPTVSQQELFVKSFKNLELCQKVLERYFSRGGRTHYHFDSTIHIKVIGAKGEKIKAYSAFKNVYMIPWQITKDSQPFETYNPRISRALLMLLPEDDSNYERLSGIGGDCSTSLRCEIAWGVMDKIRTEWRRRYAEDKIGPEIATIKRDYLVHTSSLSHYPLSESSIDLEGEFGWHATVGHIQWPSNLVMGIFIPYNEKKDKFGDLKPFLEYSKLYVHSLLSISWFSEYLHTHPEITSEIRFVETVSMSKIPRKWFIDQLKQLGKITLAQKIRKKLDKSLLLQIYKGKKDCDWSHWVVLPDKTMILWQFQSGLETVLKWYVSEFKQTERWGGGEFTGILISPDGSIEPD